MALVSINLARIFTLLIRILAVKLDGFVTGLGERSEEGLSPTEGPASVWTSLPARVAWGSAAVLLRTTSIATVFVRQLAVTVDEFFRVLAEGEQPSAAGL